MRTRKCLKFYDEHSSIETWLKFYDEHFSIETGIDTDDTTICFRIEDYERIPNVTEVRLTPEEAKELAYFLLKLPVNLNNRKWPVTER